jgi:chromosome partitioning protein
MITRVIFNQKGGVGKSSISVNLAAISAQQGLRTLLIDLDSQANASLYLLGEQHRSASSVYSFSPNIYDFFNDINLQHQPKHVLGSALDSLLHHKAKGLQAVVHQTRFANLSLIPASAQLHELTHVLEAKHKIYKFKDALHKLSAHFDRVYIDTAPAFNFFTLSALIAADRVLIPCDCDIFSHHALLSLLENILETRQDHHEALKVEGIIINQFQAQAKLPREMVAQLQREQLPLLSSMLPSSVLMKESHQQHLPLIHFASEHKLTQAYLQLFAEIEAIP